MSVLSETELIEAARRDSAAFGALYDRYRDAIHLYICRRVRTCYEAEELVASVFEAALRGMPRYEQRGSPFLAWLYRIASNKVADHVRRFYRYPDADLDAAGALTDGAPDPAELASAHEDSQVLRRALDSLSPADQTVIMLSVVEERPRAEVAAVLGCSTDAVYVRLHRALRRLRARLEQEEVLYA